MANNFSKVKESSIVLLNRGILEDILGKRLYPKDNLSVVENKRNLNYRHERIKIEDLWLACPAPAGVLDDTYEEGEDVVETQYGKLRVFFIAGLTRSHLLHVKKYPFPKTRMGKVKSRAEQELNLIPKSGYLLN